MRQAEFFMEYDAYQGFKALPENPSESRMYCLIIKEKEAVKLRIGVSAAVTLNAAVSGVDEHSVYDWLWNQGLSFLQAYDNGDREIKDVTLLIESEQVIDGELDAPWDTLMVQNMDENGK